MNKIVSGKNIDLKTDYQQTPYLRIELSQNTAAILPMKNAREVLRIKRDRITVMPNMPTCIFGLLNQRSRIFWVIDLSQLLELPPIDRSLQAYNLIIVRTPESSLGLIVPKIKNVIRFTPEDIQSPIGNVNSGLVPYLQGCILQKPEILLVLDAEAIINSPVWQTH